MPGLPVPLPPPFSPPLFGLCELSSSFALWLGVLCSLPFTLSFSCSLLCLDFLTKDCQGFQLIVTLSFPPDCTFLPHCCVRRLIRLPCINLWVRAFFSFSCFVSRCLNCLAKDVSGFSTLAPSPLFCLVCVGWVGVLCFVLCVGLSWLPSVLVVLLWVFLLFVDFAIQY